MWNWFKSLFVPEQQPMQTIVADGPTTVALERLKDNFSLIITTTATDRYHDRNVIVTLTINDADVVRQMSALLLSAVHHMEHKESDGVH
jgi:hypothetical protein